MLEAYVGLVLQGHSQGSSGLKGCWDLNPDLLHAKHDLHTVHWIIFLAPVFLYYNWQNFLLLPVCLIHTQWCSELFLALYSRVTLKSDSNICGTRNLIVIGCMQGKYLIHCAISLALISWQDWEWVYTLKIMSKDTIVNILLLKLILFSFPKQFKL